jgi:hypothetical protein
MGFLSDLGRSNALTGVNQVLGKAIELRQADDHAAEKAYTLGLQTEKFGLEKQAAEREATQFEWKKKAQQEQDALDKVPMPVTSFLGTGWENDPAKKFQVDKFKELGLVNEPVPGLLMTTGGGKKAFKQYAADNLDFTLAANKLKLLGLQNSLTQVGAAIAGDKDAVKALGLKPEELAAKKEEIEKQISAAVDAHQKTDTVYQEKLALERAKKEQPKVTAVLVDRENGDQFRQLENGMVLNSLNEDVSDELDMSKFDKLGSDKEKQPTPHYVTLDLPGPDGKKPAGGSVFAINSDGTKTYIGPGKEPAAVSTARTTTEPLTEREQKTVDTFVDGIKRGAIAPSQMNSFLTSRGTGPIAKMKIAIGSKAIDEGLNLPELESNYKAKSSTFAINRVQLAKTVLPMADAFSKTVGKIPDGLGFVPADEFARKVGKSFNSEELAALDFQKNKMVEEFERMLTGAQMADSRITRNLDLIKTGYDKKIMKWMAQEIKNITQMSISASTSDMYPNAGGGKPGAAPSKVPKDLPAGTTNNGDGTFTLPNGKRVRPE